MLPGGRLGIDLGIVGMARRLQRQDGPPVIALVGEDGDPRALREAARPMADRHQREPAVRLQPLHRGAERVEMGDDGAVGALAPARQLRSEEHTSELQSLMRISYAVFCLKNKNS